MKDIQIHSDKKNWYKYILPKQLTKSEPIFRWLFWVYRLDKPEYQEKLLKQGQRTFVYCPHCETELISSNSFVADTDYVYYKCANCKTETKWDFDFLCPILVEYKPSGCDNWLKYQSTKSNDREVGK